MKTYDLSQGQQGMWVMHLTDPTGYFYNSNLIWEVTSDFDLGIFSKIMKKLHDRHEIWRSTFELHEDHPVQVVHDALEGSFEVSDVSHMSDHEFQEMIRNELYQPFDLSKEPGLRWKIWQRKGKNPLLSLRMQHLANDGWSIFWSIREIGELYTAEVTGGDFELPPVGCTLEDFVTWEKDLLSGNKGKRHKKHWTRELAGDLPLLNLPTDNPHPPNPDFRNGLLRMFIKESQEGQLTAAIEKSGLNAFNFFLAVYQTLLYRYTGQSEIITGSPAGFRMPKFHHLYGCLLNPIVFRTPISPQTTFMELAKVIEGKAFAGLKNQHYPFPQIVNDLALEADPVRSPIFQNMYVFEDPNAFKQGEAPLVTLNEDGNEAWNLGALQLSRIHLPIQVDNYDMRLRAVQVVDKYVINFEYREELFDRDSIELMASHFQVLLDGILANPDEKIGDLPILSEEEKAKIVVDWNDNRTSYPKERCPFHQFEEQAYKNPDKVALIHEDTEISYGELNRQANQMAHCLIEMGVGPDGLVGIGMPRVPDMIVAIMAVHKAGGGYVPLDPNYPPERIEYILEETKAPVVITVTELTEKYRQGEAKLLLVDAERDTIAKQSAYNPNVAISPDHLSHVIYTSGSTGKPKGVAIGHNCVIPMVDWAARLFTDEERSGMLAATSLNFDLSVYEIVATLALGGTIILVENALYLPTTPARNKVKLINTVPSAIKQLLLDEGVPKSTVTVNLAGEPLKESVVQALYKLPQVRKVYNLYGPSEDTTYSTWALMGRDPNYRVLIGQPLSNTQAFVLDHNLQLVPIGIPGELYLAGEGLSRGYLNRPDLTVERYIPNPFAEVPGDRMYKTGDLVRWLPNGEMECLGRIDHQVKIRGFRIELGEIEAVLGQQEKVHESIVVDRDKSDGEKYLVGYVTLHEEGSAQGSELRNYIGEHLPEYMVPAIVVVLDAMPLNPNGKIDRKRLPEPEFIQEDLENPQELDELETLVSEILREVLALPSVNAERGFFEMGMNSLSAVTFRIRLEKRLEKKIPNTAIFQYPTVKKLCNFLNPSERKKVEMAVTRRASSEKKEIAVIGLAGRYPMSKNLTEFWERICQGVECITVFSQDELIRNGVDPELLEDPNYVPSRAVIDEYDMFDADFFGMPPREAQITDPQHRLFLEESWNALENAGYNPYTYDGRVGVFAGCSENAYQIHNLVPNPKLVDLVGPYGMLIGSGRDFLPTRVSFKLNLKGPSVCVQTACSTSLVAVHMACESLVRGECDMALAGGVCILSPMRTGYLYMEGGTMSPDGHVRPFDHQAAGMLAGTGLGVAVLKPLDAALKDGDHILAVVKGSAINNDGFEKVGYAAPSVNGQAEVIGAALQEAGLRPDKIKYIETHGTGTPMGDPVEMAALTQVYQSQCDDKQYCALGSVKANIGHLDAAAGITGFIKTVQVLHHKKLPPLINFNKPNPQIDFENSPFYVNTQLRDWESADQKRRAGVSSFGIGGTNAHVVLEEAPQPTESGPARSWQFLVLSAKSPTALARRLENLLSHLQMHEEALASPAEFGDVAFTLQRGRASLAFRAAIACRSVSEAIQVISTNDPRQLVQNPHSVDKKHVVFMFSGQGAQYINMALDLYKSEPTFQEEVDSCCEALKPHLGEDLRHLMFPHYREDRQLTPEEQKETAKRLNQTSITQPALFVIEHSLAKLLMSWGIRPHAMIGHSVGEYVAATLAGVLTRDAALELVAIRGRLMQSQPEGSMLAVPVSEEEILPYLPDDIQVATINAPNRCVVAGPDEAIVALAERLSEEGMKASILHTSHAFHSAMMDDILEPFTKEAQKHQLAEPKIPYISNVTGTWITKEQACDPSYYASHLRGAVRFADGLRTLFEFEPGQVFLEVGPGKALMTFAKQQSGPNSGHKAFQCLRHPKGKESNDQILTHTLASLWCQGVELDWKAFYTHQQRNRVPLPGYPFEKKRFWIEPPKTAAPVKSSFPERGRTRLAAASVSATVAGKAPARERDVNKWFFAPFWEQVRSLPIAAGQYSESFGNWLIFHDDQGFGTQVAERLTRAGKSVVHVHESEHFQTLAANRYQVRGDHKEDFQHLVVSLREQGFQPHAVLFLWNLTSATPDRHYRRAFAERMLARGVMAPLFLACALDELGLDEEVHFTVVSNGLFPIGAEETGFYEKAPLVGPVGVIPREYPFIQCKSLDITLPAPGTHRQDMVIDQLLGEAQHLDTCPFVAYRGTARWQRRFEQVGLPQAAPERSRVRHGGTYLITGGLGGIGLALAHHLFQSHKAKLVLLRRSPFPARDEWADWLSHHPHDDATSQVVRQLMALEQAGAEIMTASADISDLTQMRGVVQTARRRFGAIHGVFHAAGMFNKKLIRDLTAADIQKTMGPKMFGTLVLDSIFRDAELDFMVLFSSSSVLLSNMGYCDYAASNAFLDSFAHHGNQSGRDTHYVAINWDGWRDVGMGVKVELPPDQMERHMKAMEALIQPQEGMAALDIILSAPPYAQIVATPFDFPKMVTDLQGLLPEGFPDWGPRQPVLLSTTLNQESRAPIAPPQPVRTPEPAKPAPAPAAAPQNRAFPRPETVETVLELWKEFLGIETIGVNDLFEDLGGDSLLTTTMAGRLRKQFKKRIPPDVLNENPTVKGWAEQIDTLVHGETAPAASPAAAATPQPANPEPAPVAPARNPTPSPAPAPAATGDQTLALVIELWKEFLGVEEVHPESQFEDLGGDSLLATSMAGRLRKKLKTRVPPDILGEHPTPKGWADQLNALLGHAPQPNATPPAAGAQPDKAPQAANPSPEPAPQAPAPPARPTFTPPSTETEKALVTLWKDAFGKSEIGIDDHFLELGGHSELASKLVDAIKSALSVDLQKGVIIDASTIRELAERVDTLIWAASNMEMASDISDEEDEEFEL
ncbi:Amino acid adenylation domain-containing protein [Sulfidibacter corallicola]|uniref:Amino acid adenylation domain-containing protein n=1 Tax=Sulfidibacter corallicola TaxID=2818388 RepID=A0A8A4TGV0_SULCO|nr:non-ribosomal peptide synthetase/type I polyketide synthase [Sulfidibacter corallicola]QTD48021.1 amino acid adenylation domain-containing protein [Sulfidibacter corallicola]